MDKESYLLGCLPQNWWHFVTINDCQAVSKLIIQFLTKIIYVCTSVYYVRMYTRTIKQISHMLMCYLGPTWICKNASFVYSEGIPQTFNSIKIKAGEILKLMHFRWKDTYLWVVRNVECSFSRSYRTSQVQTEKLTILAHQEVPQYNYVTGSNQQYLGSLASWQEIHIVYCAPNQS